MIRILMICLAVCLALTVSAPANALELKAFGDITFGDSTKKGDASGFTLGQLDLWGTHKIDKEGRLKAFLELVVESPGSGFVVDLERLWVEYALMPELRVRGGRFHTSMGYWNRTHHHGAHMQTTVFRPLFLDFEDGNYGVVPTHMVGFMGVTDYNSGIGDFHLELQLGNGTSYNNHPDSKELDPGNAGDVDDSKSVAGRLVFTPKSVEGLGIGFSYINNPVKVNSDIGNNPWQYLPLADQTISEADLFYIENNMELIFEYYWITNKDTRLNKTAFSRTSTAWYAQAGYTFFERLTPYVRYEFFDDIDPDDPYFTILGKGEYTQLVFGSRFDINNNSSIKIEGRSLTTEEPGDSSEEMSDSYWLQWTFAF